MAAWCREGRSYEKVVSVRLACVGAGLVCVGAGLVCVGAGTLRTCSSWELGVMGSGCRVEG